MANPTTNYGFVLPTPTDLVTDLPADFDVALQGVDTRLKALQPGTTLGDLVYASATANTNTRLGIGTAGQVLAVSSGVPAWTTTADVTPLTTKGDLFTFTTVDARLAVGSNGETLVADSVATTGLRYSATPSASNPVLNSAMQVWQRGTSFTGTTTAFGPDRWQVYRGTTGSTFSRQVTGDTTNLPNIQYAVRGQRDSGNTAVNAIQVTQNFESINSIPFAGKTITVSFYARAGANYSSASSILKSEVYTGTGTDQNIYTGFTGVATAGNNSLTLTTTWQRFSASMSIGSTATQIAMIFSYTPVGTAGAADYFEVTGVQVDIGSVALPFRTQNSTIQGELAACQRYFQIFGGNDVFEYYGIGANLNTVNANCVVQWYVPMRTAPTATFTTASNYRVTQGTSANTCTGATGDILTKNNAALQFTVASGLTSGNAVRVLANNTLSATISISAEL